MARVYRPPFNNNTRRCRRLLPNFSSSPSLFLSCTVSLSLVLVASGKEQKGFRPLPAHAAKLPSLSAWHPFISCDLAITVASLGRPGREEIEEVHSTLTEARTARTCAYKYSLCLPYPKGEVRAALDFGLPHCREQISLLFITVHIVKYVCISFSVYQKGREDSCGSGRTSGYLLRRQDTSCGMGKGCSVILLRSHLGRASSLRIKVYWYRQMSL